MNLYIVDLFQTILYNEGTVYFSDCLTTHETQAKIKEIKRLIKDESAFIIFYAMGEKWAAKNLNKFLEFFNIKHNHPRILFVLDALNDSLDNHEIKFNNWVKYSSQLIKVSSWEDQYSANKLINLNTNKFLYLMGKPYKRWRIKTLYNLYKEGLLKNCEYSFHTDFFYGKKEEVEKMTYAVISELTHDEFNIFVSNTLRNLDYNQHDWTGVGLPVDISLYQNTSFSLISETTCDSVEPWFISEKTWRTVANRHCFLPLFTKATFDHVHGLGLDTFQEILPVKKEKFEIKNDVLLSNKEVDQIIDMTMINLKFLLESINDNRIYVTEKINQNYDCYQRLIAEHRHLIPKELEIYFGFGFHTGVEYKSLRKLDTELSKLCIKSIWG